MPVYDYQCDECGPFSARRPMAEARLPGSCPTCASPAARVVSAPQLNLMSATRRKVDARNEKSAHAPEVAHRPAHQHSSSCGHGGAHAHSGAGKSNAGHAHAPSRPWMIGH